VFLYLKIVPLGISKIKVFPSSAIPPFKLKDKFISESVLALGFFK